MLSFIHFNFSSGNFVKGQLISKRPFGFIVWTKIPTKLFLDFCPDFFCSFLGASWKLFGASCRLPCLWYYILSPQEAQRASMKPPGSYKKTQGRNPEIISLVFLSKRWNQKDILKLTDLYYPDEYEEYMFWKSMKEILRL